jgi:signal transduction histidine kinase
VVVEKSLGEIQLVECRIEELNQVIMNLVLNAYQAIEQKGKIHISTRQAENEALISIADDGPGIPEDKLDKIFLPFFSTKEKEINSGLGLSICHNIIKNHHGKIDVRSILGSGTEFVISLPVVQPDS